MRRLGGTHFGGKTEVMKIPVKCEDEQIGFKIMTRRGNQNHVTDHVQSAYYTYVM